MKYFETHAHMDDARFDEDRETLLADLPNHGIAYLINIGANMESSLSSIALADRYSYIYAAIGVHPHDAEEMQHEDLDKLAKLSEHPKVVAIGEIGLDYYYDNSPREIQKQRFIQQIELANRLNLPIIIHSRDAVADTYDLIKQHNKNSPVLLHCFNQSTEMAKQYIRLGAKLAIGGTVTFKNARMIKEVIREIGLEHFVLETDCPYLTPVPFRGKRNDPSKLVYIAEAIAELKGITLEETVAATFENAKSFFGIS